MRSIRLTLAVLFAALAISATACTNPTGPKPPADDLSNSGI